MPVIARRNLAPRMQNYRRRRGLGATSVDLPAGVRVVESIGTGGMIFPVSAAQQAEWQAQGLVAAAPQPTADQLAQWQATNVATNAAGVGMSPAQLASYQSEQSGVAVPGSSLPVVTPGVVASAGSTASTGFSFSSIPWWAWAGAAAVGLYAMKGKG
jgi:hypothetical protein